MPPMLSPNPRTPQAHSQALRSESPNYFGLVFDPNNTTVVPSGARLANPNWSPAGTSVRSAAANSPQKIPPNANSDFEAFRRKSEHKTFTLNPGSALSNGIASSRTPGTKPSTPKPSTPGFHFEPKSLPLALKKAETISLGEMGRQPRSPKRHLSEDARSILDEGRYESPSGIVETEVRRSLGSPPFRQGDKLPRLSPPKDLGDMTISGTAMSRSESLPANLSHDVPLMTAPQDVVDIMHAGEDDVLLLDLRVSTQYAKSRIEGALNLCIPTTLLKRATYDVSKLAETFKDDTQRAKFETWQTCKWIVVYDASSSQTKEATNCINVLKKFPRDKMSGRSCIIRGGFNEMAKKFANLVVEGSASQSKASNSPTAGPTGDVPPVIGGCPMPATKNAANPFFGNIRQNMDLIGGVGQIPIKISEKMTKEDQQYVPMWLADASAEQDGGKNVADKFLHIEQREQKRMQEALSGNVVYGTPDPDAEQKIQIAGIEKGSKNRYNNIWPFEHSRVKLKDVPQGTCDYVNANFIRTTRSNKKYIATQGPIPATFNDFWNMVWQRDIRVIVMLTAESEGGQIKAHNYWNEKSYGALRLTFLSEHRASLDTDAIQRHRDRSAASSRKASVVQEQPQAPKALDRRPTYFVHPSEVAPTPNTSAASMGDLPYVTVRRFTLAHENYPFQRMREITQLQYSNWPDFGAPAHPAHLLGLVQQCDSVVRSVSSKHSPDGASPAAAFVRPVLVHCSAGCGRTGTFCTVDSVVDMLKRQRQARVPSKTPSQNGRSATPMDLDFDAESDEEGDDDGEGAFLGMAKKNNPIDNQEWVKHDEIDLIEATVEEFRLQRLSMVQSLRQFVLCYESILEWIAAQPHEVST